MAGRRGRWTVAIVLSEDERDTRQRWGARRHTSSQALAGRRRIVLASAEGGDGSAGRRAGGVNPHTVSKWRHRSAGDRLGAGGRPRPGARRTVDDETVDQVVADMLESAPADATRWSTRPLARRHGISHETVAQIWGRSGSSRGARTPSSSRRARHVSGTVITDHRHIHELAADIRDWIEQWNADPNPFV